MVAKPAGYRDGVVIDHWSHAEDVTPTGNLAQSPDHSQQHLSDGFRR
jgi:hypothetical protein